MQKHITGCKQDNQGLSCLSILLWGCVDDFRIGSKRTIEDRGDLKTGVLNQGLS